MVYYIFSDSIFTTSSKIGDIREVKMKKKKEKTGSAVM